MNAASAKTAPPLGDAIEQFRSAVRAAGIEPPDHLQADHQLHRFSSSGEPGDDAGWYVLHPDGVPAGAFGCFRLGIREAWRMDIGRSLSPAEEAMLRTRMGAIQREREADEARRRAEARDKAASIWNAATPATTHPYLIAKNVKAHGLRVHRRSLVIPMREGQELHGLQFISGDGEKRFLSGGRVGGCYYIIGEPGNVLCIAEGYATAATLCEATGYAVAVAFNAGNLVHVARKLRERYPKAQLIVCGDNDQWTTGNPGATRAREAAQAVGGLLALPVFKDTTGEPTDFNDLAQLEGPAAVKQQIGGARKPQAQGGESEGTHDGEAFDNTELADDRRKSAATRLVEIAEAKYRFGHSTEAETFAVAKTGPKIVYLLRGSRTSLRGQLARTFFRRTGKAAPQQALADALLVIDGLAQEGPESELYLRVARKDRAIWVDMGDEAGRALRIDANGWRIEPEAPVLFKRTALTGALPEPQPGDLNELWERVNVVPEDRPLLAAWAIAALYPDIPHPAVVLQGEQGTGKSSAQRHLSLVLDPGPVPVRKAPRDADSWVTAAAGSWIVGLDNLSAIPAWLSDSLCRAVTGDGDVRRKLYTDGEHQVFAFRRCLILNSIDLGALRGDLAERALTIVLNPIPEDRRLAEEELWQTWPSVQPRILSALLDLAARVAAVLPSVRLESKPRMADFARILAAVDRVLGTRGFDRYRESQIALAADSLSGDPFALAMMECLSDFTGTSAELLERVTPKHDGWRPPKGWPVDPRSVTQRLTNHAPALRKSGWTVTHDGARNHSKVTIWTITRPENARNSSPQDPHTRNQRPQRGSAGVAGQECGPSQDDRDASAGAIDRHEGRRDREAVEL